jgi:hypothetical protein
VTRPSSAVRAGTVEAMSRDVKCPSQRPGRVNAFRRGDRRLRALVSSACSRRRALRHRDLLVRPAAGKKIDDAPLVLRKALEHQTKAATRDPEIPLGLEGLDRAQPDPTGVDNGHSDSAAPRTRARSCRRACVHLIRTRRALRRLMALRVIANSYRPVPQVAYVASEPNKQGRGDRADGDEHTCPRGPSWAPTSIRRSPWRCWRSARSAPGKPLPTSSSSSSAEHWPGCSCCCSSTTPASPFATARRRSTPRSSRTGRPGRLIAEAIGTFILTWAVTAVAVNPRGEKHFAGRKFEDFIRSQKRMPDTGLRSNEPRKCT